MGVRIILATWTLKDDHDGVTLSSSFPTFGTSIMLVKLHNIVREVCLSLSLSLSDNGEEGHYTTGGYGRGSSAPSNYVT